jgi:hypothetical protein
MNGEIHRRNGTVEMTARHFTVVILVSSNPAEDTCRTGRLRHEILFTMPEPLTLRTTCGFPR